MTAPLMVLAVPEYRRGLSRHPGVSGTGLPWEGAGAHHEGSAALSIMALATLMGLTGNRRGLLPVC